ncbi:hypothetical protein GE115_02710 [Agromyces sp. CFH 90414]|uniref:ImmA/IrrE family metallo-endopeptidase n=1 Tax=Agromyces agglutinans TaxID=2662258 RepID=A0A6I2FCD3_9MICO|nr:hypothetical protein [Agromyces agglutinans]MRG58788.1 hypothetical protein [Agromyces agglutinans]
MNTEGVATAMRELALGDEFTFPELVAAVEERRGRSIRIIELEDLGHEAGLCALLIECDDEDLIFHAPTESLLHRQQFVLHEFAHLLLGHIDGQEPSLPDFLLPDIPPETRRRLLRRQDSYDPQEVEAESLADRFAAAIRSSARHDSRFVEIFG